MNSILLEMVGRQRHQEMVRAAEEDRRFPAPPAWEPVGSLLIRFGRRLERAGERLAGAAVGGQAVGGAR
ncbi:MAG TPA: hypothetical protein VGR25_08610 [bacterium]|jgi:hypothetical protein|nr:hypothetical protein [bacterium]